MPPPAPAPFPCLRPPLLINFTAHSNLCTSDRVRERFSPPLPFPSFLILQPIRSKSFPLRITPPRYRGLSLPARNRKKCDEIAKRKILTSTVVYHQIKISKNHSIISRWHYGKVNSFVKEMNKTIDRGKRRQIFSVQKIHVQIVKLKSLR